MGRKKLPVVPKAKKIKLNKMQKQYAKMIRSIEADLEKKKAVTESLKTKLAAMQANLQKLEAETSNLESAKKNLEGVLSQVPPPPQWVQFTKYVYEYHHHYHHHCDTGCGPNCPWKHPLYIGPWWGYYNGGSYLAIPSQSQLLGVGGISTLTTTGNVGGSISIPNSGYTFADAKTPNSGMEAPISSYVYNNTVSGLPPATGLAPSVFAMSASNANPTDSLTALQNVGFFDMGTPKSDGIQISS